MKKNPSVLPPRLITADDPDLPAEFFAFEMERDDLLSGYDVYDLMDTVREAFFDPSITLVVCSNAADFIPESLKQSVSALSQRVAVSHREVDTKLNPGFWRSITSAEDHFELAIQQHFAKIGDFTEADIETIKAWQQNTMDLADGMDDSLNSSALSLKTRFQNAARGVYDGVHTDIGLRSNSLRGLRTVDGDTTRFYGQHDVVQHRYNRGHVSISLKDGAQPWTVRPWDIAFVSQNTVHEVPSPLTGADPHARRVIEVFQLHSREEFIASAQRPFFRQLFRLQGPQVDPY